MFMVVNFDYFYWELCNINPFCSLRNRKKTFFEFIINKIKLILIDYEIFWSLIRWNLRLKYCSSTIWIKHNYRIASQLRPKIQNTDEVFALLCFCMQIKYLKIRFCKIIPQSWIVAHWCVDEAIPISHHRTILLCD